jgi:hypothetical protein
MQDRCAYWQQILRLQDWTITVEIKRDRDMETSRNGGEIVTLPKHRRAWIYLLDPTDIRPEALPENDMEKILIHELLHIYTEPFGLPDDGPKNTVEEQMINALAEALLKLDRR